ncbi:cytochrome P450 2C42-like [Pomacea canaliculata]|uniref:cytochrome P450 2C42-like n=1 Tax=Pomacea canaliculata TaxID=400727 RepID=UPI000D72E0C5|nr:cytochrome P450 2C42-like [Pomacea canaliculata]
MESSYTEFLTTVTSVSSPVPWLLALTTVSLYIFYKLVFRGRQSLPPGPKGVRIFWETLKALKNGNLHILGERWARQYGDLVLCRTLIGDFCFLNSPRMVREVYASKATELAANTRAPSFAGSCVYFDDVALKGPDTLPNWLKLRKVLHSTLKFYGDGVERLETTVRQELIRLTDSLERKIEQSAEVEMGKVLAYSVQCVVICLFTGETPSPDSELPALIGEFVETVEELLTPTTDFVLHTLPFLRYLPGSYYKRLCDKVFKTRAALMKELLDRAKESHVVGQPRGMVDVLLDEQKEDNTWLQDDNIRGVILDIVDGAYITSRETMKAFFLMMIHNPTVMKNIQKEIDDKLGERLSRLEDRRSLPYTEAAILETLRFSSFTPFGFPHAASEDIVVDGFCIPKGSVLFQNLWWVNRDQSLWGDPDVFRPERFLDDEGQLLPVTHKIRQSFLPFGIGRRSCPGENFARSRVFLYVTTLLQKFDFLPPVQHELLPVTNTSWKEAAVLQLKPYHVTLRPRTR